MPYMDGMGDDDAVVDDVHVDDVVADNNHAFDVDNE